MTPEQQAQVALARAAIHRGDTPAQMAAAGIPAAAVREAMAAAILEVLVELGA